MQPNTYKCSRCHNWLTATLFHKQNSKRGVQAYCKACTKAINAANFAAPSGERRAQVNARRRDLVLQNRQAIWDYLKTHPCIDCGISNPVVLEFDHVRGIKKRVVSMMLHYSHATLFKEIAKCDVRCANCHRIRTAEQFGWYSTVSG